MDNTEMRTLYKLIILYMLSKVDYSLTRTQLFGFILDKEYTDFFTLQDVMSELIDNKLIESKSARNASHLLITEKGRETFDLLKNDINESIRGEIDTYLEDNDVQLRNEVSISADYYKTTFGEYVAELSARERNIDLLTIKITMPTEEAANEICNNWQKRNQDVYAYLIENLL
ncbi:MAG: DUF4364 family protein [Lachnospiraceae bacterium]|nr:DUF4364 family protein [Lachnospiraceae bacterium]